MVSQGAQTNGMNGNKKLTKSFSEMGTPGVVDVSCQYEDDRRYDMIDNTIIKCFICTTLHSHYIDIIFYLI